MTEKLVYNPTTTSSFILNLQGTEMMRYVEPFSASAEDPQHPMLVLVYKQEARVELEEYQRGCSPSIVSSR